MSAPSSATEGRAKYRIELITAIVSLIVVVLSLFTAFRSIQAKSAAEDSAATSDAQASQLTERVRTLTTENESLKGQVEATPTPTATATSNAGELLGQYKFTLPGGQWAVLGAKAPTQAEMIDASSGDLTWSYGLGGPNLYPAPDGKMVSLPSGTTPTYKAYTSSASFGPIYPARGAGFCVLETTGQVAGISITSVNSKSTVPSLDLDVRVWQKPNP